MAQRRKLAWGDAAFWACLILAALVAAAGVVSFFRVDGLRVARLLPSISHDQMMADLARSQRLLNFRLPTSADDAVGLAAFQARLAEVATLNERMQSNFLNHSHSHMLRFHQLRGRLVLEHVAPVSPWPGETPPITVGTDPEHMYPLRGGRSPWWWGGFDGYAAGTGTRPGGWLVAVPHWFVVAVLLAWPAWRTWRRWTGKHRRRGGFEVVADARRNGYPPRDAPDAAPETGP